MPPTFILSQDQTLQLCMLDADLSPPQAAYGKQLKEPVVVLCPPKNPGGRSHPFIPARHLTTLRQLNWPAGFHQQTIPQKGIDYQLVKDQSHSLAGCCGLVRPPPRRELSSYASDRLRQQVSKDFLGFIFLPIFRPARWPARLVSCLRAVSRGRCPPREK